MCTDVKIFSFNVPGIFLPDDMLTRWYIFLITLPIVGINLPKRKWRKFFKEVLTAFICSSAIMRGQNRATASFEHIPRPALLFFRPNETPEFVPFNVRDDFDIN